MGPFETTNCKTMFVALALYFAVGCLLAGLLLQPFRQTAWSALRELLVVLRHVSRAASASSWRWLRSTRMIETKVEALRKYRGHAVVAVLLVTVPPALVYSVTSLRTMDAFDDKVLPSDRQVMALLEGEHLVPPTPLPPEMFTTAEVELERPQLRSANRQWERLNPEFQQLLLLTYKLMREEHGYDMVLLEGYRSPERQDMLASIGAHVTNARAWQSLHQYGRAADSGFLRDGRIVISERDPWAAKGYELYGEIAQRVGLTWGGRWQNRDLGHVELRKTPGLVPT